MSTDILIVDDEADIRNLIQGILEDEGYKTRVAANSTETYEAVKTRMPGLVVLDIWLQGSADDGLEILKKLKTQHPGLPLLMISGHGTIETAVAAIKEGAYDFIEKPFKSDRLLLMIRRALETAQLKRENAVLKRHTQGENGELIGNSPAIQSVRQVLENAAAANSRVLIKGEPGAGKDVASRLLHRLSPRREEAFWVLSCATLRADHLEAELFGLAGYQQSGGDKIGILEQAHGGTLLLDEVADMPLETQGKIVRVLQEQRFQRVGGQDMIEVDVRILATTNRDLEGLIAEGHFREDLYYRLNVVPVLIPPLRLRREDIPALANYFLEQALKQAGYVQRQFSAEALKVLKSYTWPGNVRQLKNAVEWALIMHGNAHQDDFKPEHLPPEITGISNGNVEHSALQGLYLQLPLRQAREEFEREYLLSQVNRFDGSVSKTAEFIGMERSALHRKLKSLQINNEKAEDEVSASNKDRKRA